MPGFQMTPWGITELPAAGAEAGINPDTVHAGGAALVRSDVAEAHAPDPVTLEKTKVATALPRSSSPVRPADVVKLARARLKELNAEIRRLEVLKKERAELERLLKAAKSRPARGELRALPKSNAG